MKAAVAVGGDLVIKTVDEKTRSKTGVNELLRD